MTTLVVLGAGELGGAVARQAAARSGAIRRVVLVDDACDVARGKALDIQQAGPVDGYDTEVVGTDDLSAVVGASAIVVADRHGSSGEWRGDEGLRTLARTRELNGGSLVVCAGVSQMELVERAVFEQGGDRTRILGSAPEALRGAMTALAALEAGCSPREVSLTLLGRPPSAAFVPWTDAAIGGQAAVNVLDAPALSRLDARLARLWPLGPFTLGGAASHVVCLALSGTPGWPSVFAVSHSFPNARARGIALPAIVGLSGIRRLGVPRLSPRDQVRLDALLQDQ